MMLLLFNLAINYLHGFLLMGVLMVIFQTVVLFLYLCKQNTPSRSSQTAKLPLEVAPGDTSWSWEREWAQRSKTGDLARDHGSSSSLSRCSFYPQSCIYFSLLINKPINPYLTDFYTLSGVNVFLTLLSLKKWRDFQNPFFGGNLRSLQQLGYASTNSSFI